MSKILKTRFKRVRTHIPMAWQATFESTIYNISAGGLYFRCQAPPQVGAAIEMKFTLPDIAEPIAVSGIVRWVSAHAFSEESEVLAGVGVEFNDLNVGYKEKLTQFVLANASEKRFGNRIAVRLLVDYLFAGENYRTIANELSRHGMFLVSDDPHQLGDILHLRFHLPDMQAIIKARATVRWQHSAIPETLSGVVTPGMGVEFTDISEEDMQVISQYIDKYPAAA